VLCCAVLCCAVLCCAVLCCAVLCCAVLCVLQGHKHEQMMQAIGDRAVQEVGQMLPQVSDIYNPTTHLAELWHP
jgi:hypothetical protein